MIQTRPHTVTECSAQHTQTTQLALKQVHHSLLTSLFICLHYSTQRHVVTITARSTESHCMPHYISSLPVRVRTTVSMHSADDVDNHLKVVHGHDYHSDVLGGGNCCSKTASGKTLVLEQFQYFVSS